MKTYPANALTEMLEDAWEPALDAQGHARDDAQVVELTGLLRRYLEKLVI